MDSSSSSKRKDNCTSPQNTTFIRTDVSNFKKTVQNFTGLREEKLPSPPPTHNHSPTVPPRPSGKSNSGEMAPRRQPFKLHERRESARKLEIKLMNNGGGGGGGGSGSPSSSGATRQRSIFGLAGEMVVVSPVSPLELLARGSPTTPTTPSSATMDDEMKGINEKGYYFHPNNVTPRGVKPPPLLPLFPIDSSPRDNQDSSSSS